MLSWLSISFCYNQLKPTSQKDESLPMLQNAMTADDLKGPLSASDKTFYRKISSHKATYRELSSLSGEIGISER